MVPDRCQAFQLAAKCVQYAHCEKKPHPHDIEGGGETITAGSAGKLGKMRAFA